MTISFHCPFCTAAIEVDDEAAGTPMRCPMCATHISVPAAKTPVLSESPPPNAPPDLPPENPSPLVPTDIVPPEVFAPPEGATVGALPDPRRSSLGVNSVSRRVKRRARRGRFPWIPLVFVTLFLGILGSLAGVKIDWGGLSGELSGRALDDLDREPTLLSLETSSLPKRQIEGLLTALESEPVILSGNLMNAQIRGNSRGLNLSVRAGRETSWYEVDPRSNPRLSKYWNEHASALDATRVDNVALAWDEFLELALRVQAGQEPVDNYSPFRDRLVVPGMVRGLGYHVVARVGRELFPCILETTDGKLYFLLPPGVVEFELLGRELPSGETPFPGEFQVKLGSVATGTHE